VIGAAIASPAKYFGAPESQGTEQEETEGMFLCLKVSVQNLHVCVKCCFLASFEPLKFGAVLANFA